MYISMMMCSLGKKSILELQLFSGGLLLHGTNDAQS